MADRVVPPISTRRRAISTIAFKTGRGMERPRGADLSFGETHIPYWDEAGFERRTCRVTGLHFWTRDPTRDTCGDSTEDPYTFIGTPIIDGFPMRGKALKDAMREMFLGFFEERDHTRIEPYPVIARWRDDIHLTIA